VGPPPDAAPPLFLLHEGLGSVGFWRGFPAALQAATGVSGLPRMLPAETWLVSGVKHSPRVEALAGTCSAIAAFARRVLASERV
jgi:hypothetical protein